MKKAVKASITAAVAVACMAAGIALAFSFSASPCSVRERNSFRSL